MNKFKIISKLSKKVIVWPKFLISNRRQKAKIRVKGKTLKFFKLFIFIDIQS